MPIQDIPAIDLLVVACKYASRKYAFSLRRVACIYTCALWIEHDQSECEETRRVRTVHLRLNAAVGKLLQRHLMMNDDGNGQQYDSSD
jgi:hypothetical protein